MVLLILWKLGGPYIPNSNSANQNIQLNRTTYSPQMPGRLELMVRRKRRQEQKQNRDQ